MKHLPITLLFALLGNTLFAQEGIAIAKEAFVIGESLEFDSRLLDEKRKVNIYLPHNYHPDSTQQYPVIYLLDGAVDEDFIHVAGLVQFGSFPWIKMLPESIVVGIANVDRRRDFTYPTNNKEDKAAYPSTGQSEKFIAFIKQELQPLIEQEYKTNATKTIIGQSLGGLLASEILLKEPDLFDHYIIISPSLWWDDESLLEWQPKRFTSEKSIFIGGGKEGAVMERLAKAWYEKVLSWEDENVSVHYQFFENQDHGDALHLAVYAAFEQIFKEKVGE